MLNEFFTQTDKDNILANLKNLRQLDKQTLRDFSRQIDKLYPLVYGDTIATDNNDTVRKVRDKFKNEILLAGLLDLIKEGLFQKLPVTDPTYEQAVETVLIAEQMLIRRSATQGHKVNTISTSTSKVETEFEQQQALIEALQAQLITLALTPPTSVVAYVDTARRSDNRDKYHSDSRPCDTRHRSNSRSRSDYYSSRSDRGKKTGHIVTVKPVETIPRIVIDLATAIKTRDKSQNRSRDSSRYNPENAPET